MRTLFVIHQWGHGLPHTGTCANIPHLIETFAEWGKGESQVIWNDVSFFSGRNVREQVAEARRHFRPEIVVYTPIAYGTAAVINVAPEHMADAGCPSVVCLYDLGKPYLRHMYGPYAAAADLCVSMDGEETPIGRNFLTLWPGVPIRPAVAKTTDICFFGARLHYDDRIAALARLAEAGIAVTSWGGRGGDHDGRSYEEYLDALDAALIALNFSKTPEGLDQLKGRPFEAMGAHCCVVDQRTSPLARYFEPDVEFAAWNDHDDLVRVVSGLLADKDKARRIAAQGHAACAARWSGAEMWNRIAAAVAAL